jgi:uncharacterized protein (DUF58 family)
MRRAASPRLAGYAVLAGAGLVAALTLRRPELAVLGAPFALVLAAGLRGAGAPGVEASFSLDDERVIEGEEVGASIVVRTDTAVDRLELLLVLPAGVEMVDGADAVALRLAAGEERELRIRIRCTRWGLYDIGALELRCRSFLRIVIWEQSVQKTERLKAYPRADRLAEIVPPRETQVFTGSEVARLKGDGIEYADVRDFVPGDRVRSINWRASARRAGTLVVNDRHPERNTDVVIFVDSFADVRRGDRSTLDDAVRAAAALAARYLERRDRVGLVSFGGVLRWLQPAMGQTQRFRLVESLLETGVEPTYTWRDVNIIPARILPPKALVFALTPLVDPRFVTTVADLRARGYDVSVIEIDPEPLVEPGPTELDRLAHRLWLMQREVLRTRLARLGVAGARWSDDIELQVAVEGVRAFRRRAGLARV